MLQKLKIGVSVALLFFAMPLLTTFQDMMNEKSDVSLYAGVLLIMALVVAVSYAILFLVMLGRQKLHTFLEKQNEN